MPREGHSQFDQPAAEDQPLGAFSGSFVGDELEEKTMKRTTRTRAAMMRLGCVSIGEDGRVCERGDGWERRWGIPAGYSCEHGGRRTCR